MLHVGCASVLQGQANYRAPASVRALAAFDDSESKRKVLTIKERTGFVVLMKPMRDEKDSTIAETMGASMSPASLRQVQQIFCDDPSQNLWQETRNCMPNLMSLSLDTTHLAMVYEYATWRRRTPGSRALRRVMVKFNQVDTSMRPDTWGSFYTGSGERPLDAEETRLRDAILDGSLGLSRSKLIMDNLDCSKPFYTRIEFIECLAALARLHPEVAEVYKGSHRVYTYTHKDLVWHCCSRLEPLMSEDTR